MKGRSHTERGRDIVMGPMTAFVGAKRGLSNPLLRRPTKVANDIVWNVRGRSAGVCPPVCPGQGWAQAQACLISFILSSSVSSLDGGWTVDTTKESRDLQAGGSFSLPPSCKAREGETRF